MTKRDKILTALGGGLGGGLYLLLVVWLKNWFHADAPETAWVLLGLALSIALGCMAGLATRPFADDGMALVRESVLHYLITTALFIALIWSMGGNKIACVVWGLILTVLYGLIWLGRWIGWYMEVMQLRALLGLDPGPSPLKWQETLPYLPLVLILCDGLPLAARGIDRLWSDIPILSGMIVPYLLLPVIGFMSGLSLGKRQGVCPLYPVICFLCYLPMVFLLFNFSALFHCFMVAVPALAGNVMGWLYRRAVPRKSGEGR